VDESVDELVEVEPSVEVESVVVDWVVRVPSVPVASAVVPR